MRMWMINPKTMCRQHLLGEHVELHMIIGCWKKMKSLEGYRDLIELHSVPQRHLFISEEMKRRGYNHHSPITVNLITKLPVLGYVDRKKSREALHERCPVCKRMWEEYYDLASRLSTTFAR